MYNWEKQLLDGAASVFEGGGSVTEGSGSARRRSIFYTGRSVS